MRDDEGDANRGSQANSIAMPTKAPVSLSTPRNSPPGRQSVVRQETLEVHSASVVNDCGVVTVYLGDDRVQRSTSDVHWSCKVGMDDGKEE